MQRFFALVAMATCGACGGGQSKYAVTGMLGIPSSTVVTANLVFADAALDGSPDQSAVGVLIDTGSPVVLIDPTLFGLPAPASGGDVQTHADLGLLRDGQVAVTIQQIPVLQLSAAMMDQLGFPGILGGNVLRQFSIQLDYAAPTGHGLCVGCTAGARDDVTSPGAAIPFHLRGGFLAQRLEIGPNVATTVTAPPTRVPVTVTIEGTAHAFILDTGASEVSIVSSLFDALAADGRPQIDGVPITTVTGGAGATVTRTKSMAVGDQVVTDVPVEKAPEIDGLLADIGREIGSQIEGVLGGSFLRNFLVTIDYPAGELHLQRYDTQTWSDELKRVGIALIRTPGTAKHWYEVGLVFPGTDAASKGIALGDEVLSIDGVSLDGVGPVTADLLLDGTVGTSKTVVIASADTAAPVTLQVLVDDLVPSP